MVDIPNNTTTTFSITPGTPFLNTLEIAGDEDWVAISLTAGQYYEFSLSGTGSAPLTDPYLQLRDNLGNILTFDDDSGPGRDSLIAFTASTTATYYVNVGSAGGAYSGSYQLSAATNIPLPIFDTNDVVYQIFDGYWEDRGDHGRAFDVGNDNTLSVNVTGLTAPEQAQVLAVLRSWTSVTDIKFVPTSGAAQITFDDAALGAFETHNLSSAAGYYHTIASSNVNIGTDVFAAGASAGTLGYQLILREIGHALGLGDAGNYDSNPTWSPIAGGDNVFLNDSWQLTVMSRLSQDDNPLVAATLAYNITPTMADVRAIDVLYPVNPFGLRAGNTTYGFSSTAGDLYNFAKYTPGNFVALTIFDTNGFDTLDLSGFTGGQYVNLIPGNTSNIGGEVGNLTIAANARISQVIGGSGNDFIITDYTYSSNTVHAGAGNDYILYYGYNHTIDGGADFDTVSFYYNGPGFLLNLPDTGTFHITNVEQFIGSNMFGDTFVDTDEAHTFIAGGGNDYVANAAGGADVLDGGSGYDTVSYFYSQGAVVNLTTQTAIDGTTGQQTGSTDLVFNFEQVYGSNTGNDIIIGDAMVNGLFGFGGNDILVGGRGSDGLTGGLGNDVFGFNRADLVAGETDTIGDFHFRPGDADNLYFHGITAAELAITQAGLDVYVSVVALGASPEIIVRNASLTDVQNSLIFA